VFLASIALELVLLLRTNTINLDQEECRSSGVQEFRRVLNLERTEERSDLTGLFLDFKPPLDS
jgi:hypothetical protein